MTTTPAPPSRPRRRWVLGTLGVLGVVALAVGAGIVWLRTDTGVDWALRQVPGLAISGMQGRPDGGAFSADRITWTSATMTVTAETVRWRDLQWQLRPHAGALVGIALVEPHARRVTVQTRPDPQPATPRSGAPDNVRLPLELDVRGLAIGTVQVNDLPPVEGLRADFHLGDEDGRLHRVQQLSARMAQRQAEVRLTLRTAQDMALAGVVTIGSLPGASQPLQAHVDLSGTLPRPQLRARLDAGAGAQLQANATLAPFDAWPIVALVASTRDLDLSALAAGLPATRLTGTAAVEGDGARQPTGVRLDLRNGLPGPWSALRLPLTDVQAVVQGNPSDLSRLDIAALDMQLHGARPAGRVHGDGRWQQATLTLDLALADVEVGQLHEAATPARLSGPLQLRVDGLPVPGSAPPDAAATGLTATLKTDLRGTLRRRGNAPVQLRLDGTLALPADGSLHARDLRGLLAAGSAQAAFEADVRREAAGTWRARSKGRLTRFDPSDWWTGPGEATAWQRGPHALNGDWQMDLTVPPTAVPGPAPAPASAAASAAPLPARTSPSAAAAASPAASAVPLRDALIALTGDATVTLRDSRLAGVPMRADLAFKAADGSAHLDAEVGAGNARAAAAFAIAADPKADRGEVDIDAPALAALRPLFNLIPGADTWAPRSGTLQAKASAAGEWPALRTEGEVRAERIDGGGWRLGTARAEWMAAPVDPAAPLKLSLQATALTRGEQRLDRLQAEIDGSLRQHRMSLLATSPLRPPAWTDAALSQGQAPARGGRLALQGTGRWTPASPAGGEWRGHFDQIRAAPPTDGSTPWVDARQLDAMLRFGPAGELTQAALAPNSAQLLGATLRWKQASYAASAG
ncbi:MAG: hypothetical protein ACM32J_06855, partial [Rhizobacter sp.]